MEFNDSGIVNRDGIPIKRFIYININIFFIENQIYLNDPSKSNWIERRLW